MASKITNEQLPIVNEMVAIFVFATYLDHVQDDVLTELPEDLTHTRAAFRKLIETFEKECKPLRDKYLEVTNG
jgi:hypothetical protein